MGNAYGGSTFLGVTYKAADFRQLSVFLRLARRVEMFRFVRGNSPEKVHVKKVFFPTSAMQRSDFLFSGRKSPPVTFFF